MFVNVKSYVKILFVALFSFIFILSCSNGENAKYKNHIIVNIKTEPKTIDPSLNTASDANIYINHMFEGLAKEDKDYNLVPGIAESWDISEDGLTYIFHIRSNAKWSDGKPVTANDFVYTWRRVVDPAVASQYSFFMEYVKNGADIIKGKLPKEKLGVEALDNNTLKVTLEYPTAYFPELTAFSTYKPVREDIISTNEDNWTLKPETYIGNGPYKMIERVIDGKIVMEKNTNYWDKDNMVPDAITFVMMENGNTAVAGVREGSLHFSYDPPLPDIPKLKTEGLAQVKPALALYYFMVNVTNGVLTNINIRRALALSIDRNYIVENIANGAGRSAAAFIPYGFKDIKGDFRENGGDYFSLKQEDYTNNIEEAKKLLADAGFPNGEGFPVLEIKTDPGMNLTIMEAVQEMWKKNLNIDTTITSEEWAVFLQTRRDRNYSIARGSWSADYYDPMTFADLPLSSNPQNPGGYSNAAVDKLILKAKSSIDNNERMTLMHQVEDIYMGNMHIIPIYFNARTMVVNPKLKDVVVSPFGSVNFDYAYLEK